ncbi:hypothetical protein [Micromonospora sp. CP22]|uniref:hypothetical protein n=1 Tax=Micromonospora sp. CP22 TaxID=2580517 RepID=UPI0012BB86DD|nr:hypothetical protein [Micromonospora sp. CP22]MTK03541.1 hypothetical protein [Micromonospora sp. CP22]
MAGVRWTKAGEPVPIAAPPGASTVLPAGDYTMVVDNRRAEVFTDLRNDRGVPTIATYAMPSATTWDQVRSGVAGQLDGWKQIGNCDDLGERQVQCAWSESTRLWPRLVRIVLLRPAESGDANSYVWPDNTFLVIGSAHGVNR